ncbi:MAG TPA: hypothetical protein VL995_15180 [Cellvibrio sp.]|nr:hypothetical protein [Cellvibrio sp.]
MNRIQRINLFLCLYCLVAITALIIFSANLTIYTSTFSKVLALLILTTLVAVACYFIYFFWRKCQPQEILIIGDSFAEQELLFKHYQNNNAGNLFLPKIIPSPLLINDSPRTRSQLKFFKGSSIVPPRIMVFVDANHFCYSSELEKNQLIHNFNRVLHLLHHQGQQQEIDLVFTNAEKISGYPQFSKWASLQQKPLRFNTDLPLGTQLAAYKNYSYALTRLSSNDFLSLIGFFNTFSNHIDQLDKLAENLLFRAGHSAQRILFMNYSNP